MDLYIVDKTNTLSDAHRQLTEELLNFAGRYLQLKDDTEMSVTFVDNAEIRQINREYRHKDRATDVISFAIEDEMEDFIIDDEDFLNLARDLGDIFLSLERVAEQAQEYGHSFERELGFLLVHGFLHLNGYDHMTPEEEKVMFALQNEILNAYGLAR